MKQLEGKVTLVTGASRGIGKGIAIGLGEAGATVYITSRSLEPSQTTHELGGSLRETATAVETAGGKCIPIVVDHRDDLQVEGLFTRIETEQNGRLDLLVNNAYSGVNALKQSYQKPFWQQDGELWDACNNVGLRSHYIASIFAARLMTKNKSGLICTISSWGGLSYIFGPAYGAGKSACDRLASDMAVELKPYQVTSLSLWPGIVGTEHITDLAQSPGGKTTLGNGYNWETPLLTGRVIAALTTEPNLLNLTGSVQIVAELAEKYRLVDVEGNLPVSMRSLRFLLPSSLSPLQNFSSVIPDWKIPWWVLLITALKSPRIILK